MNSVYIIVKYSSKNVDESRTSFAQMHLVARSSDTYGVHEACIRCTFSKVMCCASGRIISATSTITDRAASLSLSLHACPHSRAVCAFVYALATYSSRLHGDKSVCMIAHTMLSHWRCIQTRIICWHRRESIQMWNMLSQSVHV